jgi:hypothetical protein
MRFSIEDKFTTPLPGLLQYRRSEHSFGFQVADPAEFVDRAGGVETTSVSIGTLQIEVGIGSGAALFVWGLHTNDKWTLEPLRVPDMPAEL